MKQFIIQYRNGLGSFLDEKNIVWGSLKNDIIFIRCNNENELFQIAMDFEEFRKDLI